MPPRCSGAATVSRKGIPCLWCIPNTCWSFPPLCFIVWGTSKESRQTWNGTWTVCFARHVSYRPRQEMEQDPGFKQLIPYVIFRHRDERRQDRLFQYTRGTGQGEGRLHSKRSVGESAGTSRPTTRECPTRPAPTPGRHAPRDSTRRSSRRPTRRRRVGLINDDQTEVGQVHLGVVHLFDVERPAVPPARRTSSRCGFRPLDGSAGRPGGLRDLVADLPAGAVRRRQFGRRRWVA